MRQQARSHAQGCKPEHGEHPPFAGRFSEALGVISSEERHPEVVRDAPILSLVSESEFIPAGACEGDGGGTVIGRLRPMTFLSSLVGGQDGRCLGCPKGSV